MEWNDREVLAAYTEACRLIDLMERGMLTYRDVENHQRPRYAISIKDVAIFAEMLTQFIEAGRLPILVPALLRSQRIAQAEREAVRGEIRKVLLRFVQARARVRHRRDEGSGRLFE